VVESNMQIIGKSNAKKKMLLRLDLGSFKILGSNKNICSE
jgi:hypothetical protein